MRVPLLPSPQYLWRPVLSAQGGRFFMWKRARSSWGGIHSLVLGSSCRGVSLPRKPCLHPQSSALLSPTAQPRGNVPRHLTCKLMSQGVTLNQAATALIIQPHVKGANFSLMSQWVFQLRAAALELHLFHAAVHRLRGRTYEGVTRWILWVATWL